MSASDCDILSELYKLRSHAGVIRCHAQFTKQLQLAADMASIQETISTDIEKLEKRDAPAVQG